MAREQLYAIGTRVEKVHSEPGDAHQDGDLGSIVRTLGPVEGPTGPMWGYFVEWDDIPRVPVFIKHTRVRPIEPAL